MKKTSLYLDHELDRDLDRLARERGVSKADLIRSGLRTLVEGLERPAVRAIGVGHGPGDVASDVDRHLHDTGFGS